MCEELFDIDFVQFDWRFQGKQKVSSQLHLVGKLIELSFYPQIQRDDISSAFLNSYQISIHQYIRNIILFQLAILEPQPQPQPQSNYEQLIFFVLQILAYNCLIIMSDNFRVAECLHTPSSLFVIYDYTKIAYLAGNYLCLREVVNNDTKPTFISLENPATANRYFGLIAVPNCLVLAEQSQSKDIILHFYQQEEHHLRYISELSRRNDGESSLKMEMHNSGKNIYVLVHRELDLEVIIIDLATKMFIGRAFINGDIGKFKVKSLEHLEIFSVSLRDAAQIVEYEVVSGKPQQQYVRIIERGRWQTGSQQFIYCWAKDELIVQFQDHINIYLEGKLIQTIPGLKGTKLIEDTISGFLIFVHNQLFFYKKSSNLFQLRSEYELAESPCDRILLSPQEDMLAFYSKKHEAIYFSYNFQNQQNLQRKSKVQLQAIEHNNKKIKIFNSPQTLFVISSENTIDIYSPVTYQCYISVKMDSAVSSKINQSQRRLMRSNTMMPERVVFKVEEGERVETIGIHPVNSILGIAFKNTLKLYHVMYSELKVIKEILISHCKEVGFNKSGSIMYAKVSGKQGSKIYLYNALSNYQFLQVLSSNKPIQSIRFSLYDNFVYGIHRSGYYSWSLESLFKHRSENSFEIPFPIKGGEIYLNSLLIWGESDILVIDQTGSFEAFKLIKPINNLLIQQGFLICTTANGDLYRCKGLTTINTALSGQSFKIFENALLFTVRANNIILCLSKQGNILCVEWGNEQKNGNEIISIERKKIVKYQEKYKQYEDHMSDLEEKLTNQLEHLKEEFSKREKLQRLQFVRELQDRQDRYLAIRGEKLKLEQSMQQNMHAHEQQTLQQVKQLEKMYERKIAITTNKLLTSEQMGFRNDVLARENLHILQHKHCDDIQGVRDEYGKQLMKQLQDCDQKDMLFAIKREYETRLSELEQENENLLKRFQAITESSIVNLKKNVVNLELKYSEEVSQKVNLQKEFEDKHIELEVLRAKNQYVEGRLGEEIRRSEQLSREYTRIEALTVEKDESITCLEKRVEQLEKSNEIFKYRIIEMKNVNDPKEEQILKLKDNMIELEEQYEKITKRAHDYEQNISLLKKDSAQTKIALNNSLQKERKLDKNYGTVIDKIREATKAPIQEIRKMLIKVLEQFDHPMEGKQSLEEKRSNSPLGELNRVREHLEICLMEVVETGKKNEKHKNVQISRKNRENSELLREINDLRVKVRDLQSTLKDKQLQLQQMSREGKAHSSFKAGRGYDRNSTNFQSQSREMVKNRTKQSFFEKSMFKGYWREKRLKTEQGSRKKSAHSLMKQQTHNLYIQSKGEEVEQLRRLLDQKQTIIKQLINKIHKLS